jgi:hypothetical protein
MAARKSVKTEWVGVAAPIPGDGTGAPTDRSWPHVLAWISPEGALLGYSVGTAADLTKDIWESLAATIARPMVARAPAPARVRIASPELAAALRAAPTKIEVVCAPTPEVVLLHAALAAGAELRDAKPAEESYLSAAIGPATVQSFFRAAAGLFRAAPWKIVPNDHSVFAFTCEALGVEDAILSVIGQQGQTFGFIAFFSLTDFHGFLAAANGARRGQLPDVPPHLALNFERGAELAPSLRKEITKHRWEVAAADAYPWLIAVDADLRGRSVTPKELALLEAIALALPQALKDEAALLAAWNEGVPFAGTWTVATHAGAVDVSLRALHAKPVGRKTRWAHDPAPRPAAAPTAKAKAPKTQKAPKTPKARSEK